MGSSGGSGERGGGGWCKWQGEDSIRGAEYTYTVKKSDFVLGELDALFRAQQAFLSGFSLWVL